MTTKAQRILVWEVFAGTPSDVIGGGFSGDVSAAYTDWQRLTHDMYGALMAGRSLIVRRRRLVVSKDMGERASFPQRFNPLLQRNEEP